MDFKILEGFVLLPFVCAILLGSLINLKNPIHIRSFSKLFFLVQFLISGFMVFTYDKVSFEIFNFGFNLDGISSIFLLSLSFIFLIFIILSKTFVNKLHRVFYSIFILLYGLLNLLVLSDNIFILLLNVFWLILIQYFIKELFCEDKKFKKIKYQLFYSTAWFLIALFLISWDFIRYFVVNQIEFNFSSIVDNLYHINNDSINLAFYGFLIIIFKFFNLIPFNVNEIKNVQKTNTFVAVINNISSYFVAGVLFIKVYQSFEYLFYQNQDIISLILLFNFIYFLFLSFREDNILKFAFSIAPIIIITGIFSVFSFADVGFLSYCYSFLAFIFSISLFYFVVIVISKKMKTYEMADFKKISKNDKMCRFFVIFSFLNLAKMPFLGLFFAFLISVALVFSTSYESSVLCFAPYILLIGNLVLSLNLLNVVYKILIEPYETTIFKSVFSNHQLISLILLIFIVLIVGYNAQNIFYRFAQGVELGSFIGE